MNISRLRAQNFKSFDTVDVELGDFNVLIGVNASGKSNFLSLLTFLRDIAREGVENAVSMQSGMIELLRNVQLGGKQPTKICVEAGYGLDDPGGAPEFGWEAVRGSESVTVSGFRYEIGLQHEKSGFRIAPESIEWGGYFRKDEEEASEAVFNIQSDSRNSLDDDSSLMNGRPLQGADISNTSLLWKDSLWTTFAREVISQFRVFDFGKNRIRPKGSSQRGRSQLEEDGSNVALVLQRLLKDKGKRKTLVNLASTLLPFAEDLDVERLGGQSLLMTLQESHAEGQYLPSSLLSEGTMQVVALLMALYFENRWVMAFEEPATSLHPKLISRLVQMMREVSEDKQIFMTTHNPEMIKHVDLNDVYLVSRDEEGFSQITKPGDKKEVRIFLENDLGIDELFVQNLL